MIWHNRSYHDSKSKLIKMMYARAAVMIFNEFFFKKKAAVETMTLVLTYGWSTTVRGRHVARAVEVTEVSVSFVTVSRRELVWEHLLDISTTTTTTTHCSLCWPRANSLIQFSVSAWINNDTHFNIVLSILCVYW